MKKLLVGSAAIALGLAVAPAAHAQLQLGVAGHFKGYVSWIDQDEPTGTDVRSLDIIRDTEVHFTGETTLDNGLTVGVHIEAEADGEDSFGVDESYAYFSGAWGRVNFGDEDGAAYLLQVAAPSADSNVDGIRQYVSPLNLGVFETAMGLAAGDLADFALDYANDFAGDSDKITYLSPVFSGFQVGVSYAPEAADATASFGNEEDDEDGEWGDVIEGAVRYEGTWNNVGFNVGGGYTWASLEDDAAGGVDYEDFHEWNVGVDLNIAAFGLGAVYTDSNNGLDDDGDSETWVVGADYTTGPFKLGASYLNGTADDGATGVGAEVDGERYSAGVVYTFAPGMSFRGSAGYIEIDPEGTEDGDATYALVGTQINF